MDEWTNYHFKCLNPFLSCRDWVALSWCCKFFYRECNLKKTLYRKFKKQVQPLFDSEHPLVRDLILNDMEKFHGALSGGCMVSKFSGSPLDSFTDIDVYYIKWPNQTGVDTVAFDFSELEQAHPGLVQMNAWTDTNYHHSDTNEFIRHIHDATTSASNKWQFIKFNQDYILHGNYPIQTEFDHIIQSIEETFDLEFCKIIFTNKFLHISNLSSMVYKKSHFKFKHKLDKFTKKNWKNHTFIENKIIQRFEKYKARGYDLTNSEQLDTVLLLIRAIHIYNDYELERKRSQEEERKRSQEEERKRSQEEERKRLEEELEQRKREKQERDLALKWLTWDEDNNHEDENRERKSHILLNKKITPFSKWICMFNIDPKLVYYVMVYSKNTGLIDVFFNKSRIPLDWLVVEQKKFQRYVECMFPNYKFERKKYEKEFWKYIDAQSEYLFSRNATDDDSKKDIPHSGFFLLN
jgi:hypothetical protein